MVNARTWFTLFIISVGTVAATASCGSDEAIGGGAGSGGGGIIPGAGSGGVAGGTMGRSGSGNSGTGGGGTASGALLGSPCTEDADCGQGAVCFTGDGGPSHGMCTLACSDGDAGQLECDAYKPGSACIGIGTSAATVKRYCFDSCELGEPEPQDLDSKCFGRPDFVCFNFGSAAASAPFCRPLCRSDAECGNGLFCNKDYGLCTKAKPPVGDPVGTPCDASADTTTCGGICLPVSADDPTVGQCVELCSLGSECMYGSGSDPAPGGLCSGKLTQSSGTFDLGFCLPNCECTSDCVLGTQVCRKWASNEDEAGLEQALGAPGLCYGNTIGSVELSCGAGGDGAGGAGGEGNLPGMGGASGANP